MFADDNKIVQYTTCFSHLLFMARRKLRSRRPSVRANGHIDTCMLAIAIATQCVVFMG